MWVLGWSLVLVHFTSLLWQPAGNLAHLLRQAHFATLELLAAVCFILSEPKILKVRGRIYRAAFLAVVPASATIWLILFYPRLISLAYAAVILTHFAVLTQIHRYIGFWTKRGIWLLAVLLPSMGWMVGTLLTHHPYLLLASIPAELLLLNASLFATKYSFRNPGTTVAVSGFVLWAASSFCTIALRNGSIPDSVLPALFHFPEFIVAVGMIMIALEEDATSARELNDEYEQLFRTSPDALLIYDRKTTRILNVNAAAAQMHGYDLEEMAARKYTDFLKPDHVSRLLESSRSGLAETSKRWLHQKKDNSHFPLSVTSYDIRFRGRDARMCIGVDLTERELMFSQLLYQLEHDLITGLPNRRKLLPKLGAMVEKAKECASSCTIIVLQVERFEKINEQYGYAAGDSVLIEVARLLRQEIRPLDIVGRTGGREFTIGLGLLPSPQAATARAAEIYDLFVDPIACDGIRISIAVSVGFAVYPEDADDSASLWRDATRAQARARRNGLSNPYRLSRSISMQEQEENRVEAIMRQALITGGLEVYYQPIVDADRTPCGMEALLRLRDAAGAMISPATFIPVAETTGLIVPIGTWVLRQVCRQIHAWKVQGISVVPVAVNVSALQIVTDTLQAEVVSALDEFDLDPSLLHFEVTESSVMPRESAALHNMNALAACGIAFSIDDFGTGFSSLDRLHQLPVSVLKIDRAFVSRMQEPEGTLPIVATVLSMAHALHLSVVAEGVETEDQYALLAEMGCDQFQGFLFSKPLPAAEAVKHLSARAKGIILSQVDRLNAGHRPANAKTLVN